jgi:hypothetical protein
VKIYSGQKEQIKSPSGKAGKKVLLVKNSKDFKV